MPIAWPSSAIDSPPGVNRRRRSWAGLDATSVEPEPPTRYAGARAPISSETATRAAWESRGAGSAVVGRCPARTGEEPRSARAPRPRSSAPSSATAHPTARRPVLERADPSRVDIGRFAPMRPSFAGSGLLSPSNPAPSLVTPFSIGTDPIARPFLRASRVSGSASDCRLGSEATGAHAQSQPAFFNLGHASQHCHAVLGTCRPPRPAAGAAVYRCLLIR